MIGRLLEHARLWAELRRNLDRQIIVAENFNNVYVRRFHQEPSKDLEDRIKHFAQSITSQIDRLDQTSQDLIQIVRILLFPDFISCLSLQEFNLVSIREARKSMSNSVSMKRLSWITVRFS